MTTRSLILGYCTAAILFAGCAPPPIPWCSDSKTAPPVLAASGPVTYFHDVKPILDARCVSCHKQGGIGPFPLTTYETASSQAGLRSAVTSRRMPPWGPAACGGTYSNDPSLTDGEIATISGWIDQGTPAGDPMAVPAPGPKAMPGLSRVDLTLGMSVPYTPHPPSGLTDDTRCFLIDWPETGLKYVTGLDLAPGVPGEVHHAIVLTVGAGDVAHYQSMDGQDGAPGWSCPGGIVDKFSGWVGGWTPGWRGADTPDGLGHRVDPGSKLLLTVHYSMPALGGFQPDQTKLLLKTDDHVAAEAQLVTLIDWSWLETMKIPANAPDTVYATQYDPTLFYTAGQSIEVVSVNVHMHERGSKGQVAIRRRDGSTEPLVEIPNYDSHWQGDYLLAQPKTLQFGDQLYLECHWDNTVDHQRIVSGQLEKPRDLKWAEDQEMCVAFVTARF